MRIVVVNTEKSEEKNKEGSPFGHLFAATRPITTTCLHINNYYKRVTFLMCV